MKRLTFFYPFVIGSALIAGCSNSSSPNTDVKSIISEYVTYVEDDFYTDWQDDNFTLVHLNKTNATIDGSGGVVLKNNQLLIKTSGNYVLDGTLDDGQVVVDTEDTGNVRIVLNGVSITSSTSAPIYVKQADKVILSLEEGTENTLTDATTYVYEDGATDEPEASIFSKDDLTINGAGSLIVNGNYSDGISSRDNLLITGGMIEVHAVDDGIVGRDLFAIREATITVEADGDGVKSSNDEKEDKGNILLESGSLTINAKGDGMVAEKAVTVIDGTYNIVAGGGSPETIESDEEGPGGRGGPAQGGFNPGDISTMIDQLLEGIEISDDVRAQLESVTSMEELMKFIQENPEIQGQLQGSFGMGGRGSMGEGTPGTPPSMPEDEMTKETSPTMPEGEAEDITVPQSSASYNVSEESTEEKTEDSTSTKGIKAGTFLQVIDGRISVDSLEDALHSNQDVQIQGGEVTLSTGDDGIHADADISITSGIVSIEKSLEGIEGINITILDGDIHVVAEDDGVNVNGGSSDVGVGMPGSTETTAEPEGTEVSKESLLLIEGGYLQVNANGDGLDSNSSIKMTGGTVIVYGPTESMNGTLDYDQTFTLEGGILVAAGSNGMAMGVSDNSTQNTFMMTFDGTQKAGSAVYVENSKGEQVLAVTPEKDFQTIVISTPEMAEDDTYSLKYGGKLTGDNTDGYFKAANYSGDAQAVEFTFDNVMTYLNSEGVTEGQSGGMMGPGGRGERHSGFPGQSNDKNKDTQGS